MWKSTFVILLVCLFSCQENVRSEYSSDSALDSAVRIAVPDARPDRPPVPDIRIIYPRYDLGPDAIVDAAPPPPVCERLGLREPCEIEGLHGPCATGTKVCNITHWSACTPISFPRIEICDGLDNDCDGRLNEAPNSLHEEQEDPQNLLLSRACYTGSPGTQKNGPCHPGVSVCRERTRNTDAGVENYYDYGECEQQTVPSEEECDTIDNDCDGNTDEGVLNICNQCGPDPIEVCDGLDNDCDDDTDEGVLNDCGECGELPRELCDFVDNDCDGSIDEDFADEVCACDHPDYVPQPETCNGADDDCDGFVDEGPAGGPLSMLCSTDLITNEVITYERREDGPEYVAGDCRLGAAFCESVRNAQGELEHGYFDCQQEIRPGIERCNDADDDCDGLADEDFEQGSVAVMMVVDVSGSMDEGELTAAFTATRDSVRRLFNDGIVDVCYMLAIVGNDDMPDPYLFYPADTCVPGVEDPPVVPIEDMANAVNTLRLNLRAGNINQGGGTENTLDAMGRFFTDDRIDWDRDGANDNILWSTSRPAARIQGVEDAWDVDLSQYTHRIVIVIGDEPAQGAEWNNHAVATAMAHANGMAFIIGNRQNAHSYQPLIDFGAVHSPGLQGFGNQNQQQIIDTVVEAIEEAACINNREEEEEEGAALTKSTRYYYASALTRMNYRLRMCL